MDTERAPQHLLKPSRGDKLDKAFWIALIVKLIDGGLEIIGGTLLLVISGDKIDSIFKKLTQGELSHDPHDFIATHIVHSVTHLGASTKLFGAVYLLSHGLIKIVLVIALLMQKLWAYPWMMAFLAIFIVYQGFRIVTDWSLGLLLLTIFDGLVLWLTYLEYKRHRRKQHNREATGKA